MARETGASSSVIRVGVVGVGYLGSVHARIYAGMPCVELIGVADTNAAVARGVAAACGCRPYHDSTALLGRVDAVSVAVPTSQHAQVARPFLEQGVHMLMEKPIAASYEESRKIVELAERAGVVFQVGHLERYNAGVQALSRRIGQPRFIEVHRMNRFVARATDVDVVADLMIHDIDIVLSLIHSQVERVSAIGLPALTRHVDIANARLEFRNGAVANLTASRVSEKRFRRIRVFEKNRYEALNFIDQQIETVSARPTDNGGWPEIVRERVPVKPVQPLDRELAAFVESVRTRSRPLVDGRVALQAEHVAALVRERVHSSLS